MPEHPPVRVLKRRALAVNRVFSLFFDHVRGADGAEVENFLAVVPRRQGPAGITGVTILPVMGDRVGLLKIWRHPLEAWSWEAPKGFVEDHEDPAAGAVRELREETGLHCRPGRLTALGDVAPEPGVIQARIRMFAAPVSPEAMPASGPDRELGHAGFAWMDAAALQDRMARGAIIDAVTLAALLHWRIRHGP